MTADGHPSDPPSRKDLRGIAAAVVILLLVTGVLLVIIGIDSTSIPMMGERGHHGAMGSSGSTGSSSEPVPGAPTVTVRAGDLWFDPTTIQISAGETVNLELSNEGSLFHDLAVDDLGLDLDAEPGDRAAGALRSPRAGTYSFRCTVPGHAAAGMQGEIIID